MAPDVTGGGLGQPATKGFAITPNDGVDMAFATRAVYIGGSGNLTARLTPSGDIVLFVGLVVGSVLPARVDKVFSTGTTATNLLALL